MAYVSVYPRFLKNLWNGTYDMDDNTHAGGANNFKVMLVGTGYTFDPTHVTLASMTAHEITGTGYADGFSGAGRKALATLALVETLASSLITWKADSLTWTGLNAGTFNAMIVFHEPIGAAADSDCIPIAYCYTGSVATTGADVTLTVDGTYGIIQHQG